MGNPKQTLTDRKKTGETNILQKKKTLSRQTQFKFQDQKHINKEFRTECSSLYRKIT